MRVNVDTQERLQGVGFRDDVPFGLEIQFQLMNEMVMAGCNREVVHMNAEDDNFRGRRALVK